MNTATSYGANSPTIQQNGTVHGDTNIYYASPDDTPQRKYEVALRRLDAGMAGFAEELLGDVLRTGRGNEPDVLYHYLIAALSERSLGDLNHRQQQVLSTSRQLVASASATPPAAWLPELRNLVVLVDLATEDNHHGQLSAEDSRRMRLAYQALPPKHQRQLVTLLAGPAKDEAFREYARQARTRREADVIGRSQRVWKFFEPDPAEPRNLSRAEPDVTDTLRVVGAGAAVLLLIGLIGLIVQHVSNGSSGLLLSALLLAGAGAALGPGTSWRRTRDHELLTARQSRLDGPPRTSSPISDDLQATLRMVNTVFDAAAPGDLNMGTWRNLTAGFRLTLAHEFVEEYDAADATQGRLRWLARWHAKRIAELTESRQLLSFQDTYRTRPGLRKAGRFGTALLVLAALMLAGGLGDGQSLFPWFAATAGLIVLWRPCVTQLGRLAARQIIAQEEAERYAGERAEWERWSRILRDRPSDKEMAGWLADDMDVFKADVLEERNIRPSDVLYTVELATGDDPSWRARQPFGPVRYSRYVLTIFLLTGSGLRQFQSHLDFTNGAIVGEQRRSVPYGALREVQVEQQSIRRPQTTHIPSQSNGELPNPAATSDLVIFHRRFVIRLDAGGTFEIELGGFEDLIARSEPRDLVARLALEATGAEAALHVLETVVVDGTEWIVKERARRHAVGAIPAEQSSLPSDE